LHFFASITAILAELQAYISKSGKIQLDATAEGTVDDGNSDDAARPPRCRPACFGEKSFP
jgi:hypothetical protein